MLIYKHLGRFNFILLRAWSPCPHARRSGCAADTAAGSLLHPALHPALPPGAACSPSCVCSATEHPIHPIHAFPWSSYLNYLRSDTPWYWCDKSHRVMLYTTSMGKFFSWTFLSRVTRCVGTKGPWVRVRKRTWFICCSEAAADQYGDACDCNVPSVKCSHMHYRHHGTLGRALDLHLLPAVGPQACSSTSLSLIFLSWASGNDNCPWETRADQRSSLWRDSSLCACP